MKLRFRFFRSRALIAAVSFAFVSASAQATQETAPPEKLAKAYEESCISNLRSINVAQGTYWGGDPTKGYARTLRELGPAGVGFLEPVIASGKKDDYRYQLIPEHTAHNQPIMHYTITARPIKRLMKDQRSFFTDETNVIRFTTENRAATAADPPLDDAASKH
jgi:hypothetical protein